MNLKCHVSSISFYMPFNILCFCFISNVFAFLQISLFCCKYVLYLPSYILAFLQMFFLSFKHLYFSCVFAFLQINLLSKNIFALPHRCLFSCKYFCFHSKVFEILPITLLSCKHSYFPLYISGLLIYINFHSYIFFSFKCFCFIL